MRSEREVKQALAYWRRENKFTGSQTASLMRDAMRWVLKKPTRTTGLL